MRTCKSGRGGVYLCTMCVWGGGCMCVCQCVCLCGGLGKHLMHTAVHHQSIQPSAHLCTHPKNTCSHSLAYAIFMHSTQIISTHLFICHTYRCMLPKSRYDPTQRHQQYMHRQPWPQQQLDVQAMPYARAAGRGATDGENTMSETRCDPV